MNTTRFRNIFLAGLVMLMLVIPTLANPVDDFRQSVFFGEAFDSLATLDTNGNPNPNIVVLAYSAPARIYGYKSAVVVADVAVTTPAAVTFTCVAATDICTASAGTLFTGLKGQASTTTTLPTGLSTSTDYFPIMVTSTTFKVASSYANALAGTAIDITGTGTGTHTFTPTAIAGATVSLQGSIGGTTWFDVASSSQNVTVSAVFSWNISDTYYPFARVKFVNTAGSETSTTKYAAKSAP